jgi:WD40 repeat protein
MTESSPDPAFTEQKTKVFVSYSRADMAFADRLEAALKLRGFEPLIDRRDIEKFEDWWRRIEELIVRSDTVVFVISPDSVKPTSVCQQEVTFAKSLNKRLAPILWRQSDIDLVPSELRRLNWIDFQHDLRFDERVNELAEALETDIEWIRRHTQFGEFAQRWHAAGRPGPSGLMLRPPLLTEAEAWLGLRPRNAPEPPEMVRAFISVSREAFDQEQVAIATSQVNLLAYVGDSERLRGNFDSSLRLCVHAMRRGLESQRGAAPSAQAAAALTAVVAQTSWRLMLSGHEQGVVDAAFGPDGSHIVTASLDKTARIWDAAEAREIAVVRGHENSVYSAAFSPDGTRIITASRDNTARIWDAATTQEIAVLRGHTNSVECAAFSPDGKRIVTASSDCTARIWDVETLQEIATLSLIGSWITFAAFSPDGARIVTAQLDSAARIWDAATAQEIAVLWGHGGRVFAADFSVDGRRIVTASEDNTARIWDTTTAQEIAVLRGHKNSVHTAVFSPDGTHIVTASQDNTARIWDAATVQGIRVLRGHESSLVSAAFSANGKHIVTASLDKSARIWDAATNQEIATLLGHEDSVKSAAFSPDGGQIVTASSDNSARIWDTATAREIAILRRHESSVVSEALSPHGSRTVAVSSGSEAATARQLAIVRHFEDGMNSAASKTDYAESTGGDVNSAGFSPDGKRIVTASSDCTARIWDAATAREIIILRGHAGRVNSAAFSPDGRRVVTASRSEAYVWDAPLSLAAAASAVLRGYHGGYKIVRVLQNGVTVACAAFSPDGTRIVTASEDNSTRIWDATTAQEIAILLGHAASVNSAAFSPDGTRIVTASEDNSTRIWDATTAQEIAVLRGHESAVTSAAFSPDGRRVATASHDHTVRIWDAATGQEISVLRGHEKHVMSAAFSSDGMRVVSASEDKTARIWDCRFATMSTRDLLVEVCLRRLLGMTKMTRSEMRLAGYPDTMPEIDVGEGIE